MGRPFGPAGAAVASGAVPFLEDLAGRIQEEWRGKGQLVGEGTLAGAREIQPDITPEELWEALVGDEDLRALMMRVLDAARYTARKDKLRWLGAILGQVALDKGRINIGLVLTAALNDLEEPHVAVLRALTELPPHSSTLGQAAGQRVVLRRTRWSARAR